MLRKYKRKNCPIFLRIMAIFSILSVVLLFAVDAKIRPILLKLAHYEAKRNITEIINNAFSNTLADQNIDYSSIVSVTRDQQGIVRSVEANTAAVNRIVTQTIDSVYNQVDKNSLIRCGINIGSLTNLTLLQGRGPEIPVMSQLSRYVEYEITSTFTDAGINQTKHSIYLKLISTMYTYIPGEKEQEQITADFLLAETVIVGEVPEAYTGVFQEYQDDYDTPGTIINYRSSVD